MTKKNKLATTKIAIFQNKEIRKIIINNEWYFSIIDVVEILSNSSIPKRYWSDLKQKLKEESGETYERIVRLKLLAKDRKTRETDCANTESLFRIIQSIPSPNAEPLKRWLAKVGYERIQEIENPELAQERMRRVYKQKGYSEDWIDKRLHSIAIRQGLTDEWKERGINSDRDFAILTAEISRATFGITPSEYKDLKGLERENLRDHMDGLELIFNMLGEKVTTEISKKEKPEIFDKNKKVAQRGGSVAGKARKNTEKELGRKVVSTKNYLNESEDQSILE